MRLRATTKAILWYPLVVALATGGFAAWQWFDCSSAGDLSACRDEIGPQALLVGGSIAAIGLAVLIALWLVTGAIRLWRRRRGRAPAVEPRVSGFELEGPPGHVAEETRGETTASETSSQAGE